MKNLAASKLSNERAKPAHIEQNSNTKRLSSETGRLPNVFASGTHQIFDAPIMRTFTYAAVSSPSSSQTPEYEEGNKTNSNKMTQPPHRNRRIERQRRRIKRERARDARRGEVPDEGVHGHAKKHNSLAPCNPVQRVAGVRRGLRLEDEVAGVFCVLGIRLKIEVRVYYSLLSIQSLHSLGLYRRLGLVSKYQIMIPSLGEQHRGLVASRAKRHTGSLPSYLTGT